MSASTEITGPYDNNPRNPILSHRQFSYDHPITGVGHADFVELEDGRWYAVALGWRLIDGQHGTLGRETFLVPLTWETEPYWWKEPRLTFPVVSPESGKVELHFTMPLAGSAQGPVSGFEGDFDGPELGPEWNFRRTPRTAFHSLTPEGDLRLDLLPGRIEERAQDGFGSTTPPTARSPPSRRGTTTVTPSICGSRSTTTRARTSVSTRRPTEPRPTTTPTSSSFGTVRRVSRVITGITDRRIVRPASSLRSGCAADPPAAVCLENINDSR